MQAEGNLTVREVVVKYAQAAPILEKLGIDYCCGANETLEKACAGAGRDVADVLRAIAEADEPAGNEPDWNRVPLAQMIDHIVSVYHNPCREALERLNGLAQKVARVHGRQHPELLQVQEGFDVLREEMTGHMMKEELMLFPWIRRREERGTAGGTPPFGLLENPIGQMMTEHQASGDGLKALRNLTHGYQPPPDACGSYHALYSRLKQFEAELHAHIHLENNFLFPRAMALEALPADRPVH